MREDPWNRKVLISPCYEFVTHEHGLIRPKVTINKERDKIVISYLRSSPEEGQLAEAKTEDGGIV